MPYVTDGSSHHLGVRTELHVAQAMGDTIPECIQEKFPGQTITFQHKGGTHTVEDIEIYAGSVKVGGISVKNHGGSGTFDQINTSRITDYLPEASTAVEALRIIRNDHQGDEHAVPAARTLIKHAIQPLWNRITGPTIARLLQTIHERSPEWVCVKTPEERKVFHRDAILELSRFPSDPDTRYELRGSGEGSRQIWRNTGGTVFNTNLRLRITLNNGVGALLGVSTRNKNSSLTLKIQQDSVKKFLRAIV